MKFIIPYNKFTEIIDENVISPGECLTFIDHKGK